MAFGADSSTYLSSLSLFSVRGLAPSQLFLSFSVLMDWVFAAKDLVSTLKWRCRYYLLLFDETRGTDGDELFSFFLSFF